MKEFIDKTTENLEEKIKVTSLEIIVTGSKEKPYFEIKYKELGKEDYDIGYSSYDLNNVFTWKDECFDIVNELAEEYKDKVIIDGQYCFQTCGATEHCKECNRLSNGSIDYYENYDCLVEEYNNGWIPCSERLPENISTVLVQVKEIEKPTLGWYGNMDGWRLSEKDFAELEDFTVIAWQPLPAPYQPKGE